MLSSICTTRQWILWLIVASSWLFYSSDWRCTEPQTLNVSYNFCMYLPLLWPLFYKLYPLPSLLFVIPYDIFVISVFLHLHSHCRFYSITAVTDVIHWCIAQPYIPYILESNPHSVFGDFLNGKKLVCDSNPHLSFNHPLSTGRLIE
jgi:hypothetical protein